MPSTNSRSFHASSKASLKPAARSIFALWRVPPMKATASASVRFSRVATQSTHV